MRKLVQLVLVLLGISTVLFFVLRLSGDPVALLAAPDATAQDIANLRRALGLDGPLIVQYGRFLKGLLVLDFGRSLRFEHPALLLVSERIGATALLVGTATGFAVLVAIPVGVFGALAHRKLPGAIVMLLTSVGQAMPVFWLALLLILVFAVRLRWLPTFGAGTWRHLVLPAFTLGSFMMAKVARLTCSGMLGVLRQDFIRTARAKGVPTSRLLFVHALRNALTPVVTVIGLELSYMLGGAVIIETVFAWPGLGRQLIQAVQARDYPLVQATVFVIALVAVLINFSVDMLYRFIDPRVRTE